MHNGRALTGTVDSGTQTQPECSNAAKNKEQQLLQQLKDLIAANALLQKRVDASEAAKDGLAVKCQALEQMNGDLLSKLTAAEKQRDEFQQRAEASCREQADLQRELKSKEMDLRVWKSAADEMEAINKSLKAQVSALQVCSPVLNPLVQYFFR